MRRLQLTSGAVLFAWCLSAGAQSSNGVTVIDNPGGGSVAYAQMPAQHTLQGAMGKVLQYVHTRFGARPVITHVMRGADGSSLAVIFTVKSARADSQEVAGLALVAVSPSAPAKGAVLSDQADRFRSTVGPMLKRLQAGAGLAATGGSAAGGAGSAPTSTPASTEATAPALAPSLAAPAAAVSSPPGGAAGAAATPAAALHQTPFPDGSGSIGLPDGWAITGAHAGEVIAKGPSGAGLHFDWPIPALDPNDPRSRASRRGGAAGPIAIPHGTDAANAFKSAIAQLYQKRGKAPPTIDIVDTKRLSPQESLLVANIGAIDGQGPTRSAVDIGIGPLDSLGGYTIFLYTISFPQSVAEQSQATVTAIFHSYKVNQDVAVAQSRADAQKVQQFTESTVGDMRRRQDAQDRQFQAFDNNLLDRTVIRDTDLNGHGTVSNDLADALVAANPNRFQEVPPSEYVKGIDY
ncbi:MAG TPA: hypothetical protein VNX02_05205 [Steroidobacteraceae bacterium]|jgi:hypothetical protein|nr:hypothetical protein [Steroidobacteraceae bacterium]